MNAKQELLNTVNGTLQTIKCAYIDIRLSYDLYTHVRLPLGYSPSQYKEFLNALDFDYNNGYGSQELFGTVWLTNDIWVERGEYDGSEWWSVKKLPNIPKELLDKDAPTSYTDQPTEEDYFDDDASYCE
jgi:hypothetical protein